MLIRHLGVEKVTSILRKHCYLGQCSAHFKGLDYRDFSVISEIVTVNFSEALGSYNRASNFTYMYTMYFMPYVIYESQAHPLGLCLFNCHTCY